MYALLCVSLLTSDPIADFVTACEKRRPAVLAEKESKRKSAQAELKRVQDATIAKDLGQTIDRLAEEIRSLKNMDAKCLGLSAPTLKAKQGSEGYEDIRPARRNDTRPSPRPGEIWKAIVPARFDSATRQLVGRWEGGLITLQDADWIRLDILSESFPPIVEIVSVKKLGNGLGDVELTVKEFENFEALQSAWIKRHPASK